MASKNRKTVTKLPLVDRQSFLDQSVKHIRKNFNMSSNTNETGMTLIVSPIPDSLPVGALAETEPNSLVNSTVISGIQFPHVYPHPSVWLTCIICAQPVPSCCKHNHKSNIRFIASSPAPFTAFCDTCVKEIL